MEKFGFTEQEARAFIHLSEARDLFAELTEEADPTARLRTIVWRDTHTFEHFRALFRSLAMRVLQRDYPEGWGYAGDDEED
jgi:hypothetical protein